MPTRNIWWRLARHRNYPIVPTATQKAYVAITPKGQRRVVFWYSDEAKTAEHWLHSAATTNQPKKEA